MLFSTPSHKTSFFMYIPKLQEHARYTSAINLSKKKKTPKKKKQKQTPQHYRASHYQESARNHFHRMPCTDFSPSAGNLKVDRTQSYADGTPVLAHPGVSPCSRAQLNLRLLCFCKPWFLHAEYTDNKGTYLVTFL